MTSCVSSNAWAHRTGRRAASGTLSSPEAISALAGTITLTPGTLSADLSADGRALLVHCLETKDAEATVANIKSRYETRLQRIFEK